MRHQGDFGDHTSFELKETLRLPGPAKEEIDIEGLDVDGGYLWLIGSHSAKRKKVEDDKPMAENLERLGTIEMEGNRFTLARVPLDGAADAGARARRVDGGASAGRRQRQPSHRSLEGRTSTSADSSRTSRRTEASKAFRARTTGSTSKDWP